MTHVDMLREARSIVPPAGASKAIAVVDEQLKHRAAFLLNGRIRSAPVGPAFAKPREAGAFIDLLNGDQAPRPGQPDLARVLGNGAARRDTAGQPEAPDEMAGVSIQDPAAAPLPEAAAGVRICAGCDKPLPAGSRPNRRHHGPACRERARYHRAAATSEGDADSAAPDLTLSRPSPAEVLADHVQDVIAACNPPVPTASEAPSGERPLLLGASRDAGPDPSPGDQPALPTLGLL